MSRAARRANRARRTPKRLDSRGLQLPWIPIAIVVGVAAIIGIIVFVVLQSGSSKDFGPAIEAEADSSTTIPGQWVDLPKIYGGPYNATAGHVSTQVDYSAQEVDPPVGGPHWSGSCGDDPTTAPAFCGPAPKGIYRDPWEPETLVHNMEHAFAVVWYNTNDTAIRDQLEALVMAALGDGKLLVMAPYPEMEADTIALTSWSRIDKFPTSDFTPERVTNFIDVNERRFNPEHV
jgi:hypothetical protein